MKAASPVRDQSTETVVSGFLGSDVVNGLVQRVVLAADLDEQTQVTYNLHLFRRVKLALDNLVVHALSDKDLDEVLGMKANNSAQTEITTFLNSRIKDLPAKVDSILEEIFLEQKQALQF